MLGIIVSGEYLKISVALFCNMGEIFSQSAEFSSIRDTVQCSCNTIIATLQKPHVGVP